MDRDQIRKIIDDPTDYSDAREDTFRSMLSDFYNRRMLSTVILLWALGLVFIGAAVVCAVLFSKSSETKAQIMYAALFVVFFQFLSIMKVFAWQIIHRNGLKREIKRLELRLSELPETLARKASQS